MSDLALTFSDIYTKVSEFLSMGSSPTGSDLTLVKDLTYRGYRRFLLPKNVRTGRIHTWSFLRQTGVLELKSGEYQYPLPTDFQWFWYLPKYAADTDYPNPIPTTMEKITELRTYDSSNSYPQAWSLTTLPYSVATGTRYAIEFHPTPNAAYTMFYGYVTEPDKPTSDGDYFIGGALMSECILECALAEAEAQEDDVVGIHDQRAKDMLHSCIEMDLKRAPVRSSPVTAHRIMYNDPRLAASLRWVDAATSAYGV